MKNKLAVFGITLSILAILTSCDALLNPGSLFSALDKPDISAVTNATGNDLVSKLLGENKGSTTFYSSLSDADVTKISGNLDAIITSTTATSAEKTQASLAKVELYVQSDETVKSAINDISDTLTKVIDGSTNASSMSIADVADALTGSLKTKLASCTTDAEKQAAAAAFLSSMDAISGAYSSLAANTTESTDVGMADVQTCLVATVFDTITDVYAGDTTQAATAMVTVLSKDTPISSEDDVLELLPTGTSITTLKTDLNTKIDTLQTVTSAVGISTLTDTINDLSF